VTTSLSDTLIVFVTYLLTLTLSYLSTVLAWTIAGEKDHKKLTTIKKHL